MKRFTGMDTTKLIRHWTMSGARHDVGSRFRATDDISGEIADNQATQSNGVDVCLDEPRGATFKESDIAKLNQTSARTVAFSIDFMAPISRAVKITIDGVKATDLTWAELLPDPGAQPDADRQQDAVPRERTAVPTNGDNGSLIDNLTLTSS
jgi:hypothetical protein